MTADFMPPTIKGVDVSYIETFIAYDENMNEYSVDIHGTIHNKLSGSTVINSFSLTETGEVLDQQRDDPRFFKIKSKNIFIADMREI